MKKEEIVKCGYDKIAEDYHRERSRFEHRKELEAFMRRLPKKAKVIDVGCGAGVPVAKTLVENGFAVTGIDVSRRMLELARKHVPKGKFLVKDMTRLNFENDSFDGLTAFYSIIHVPREKHSSVFKRFHKILKAGGAMLVSVGASEWEGEGEFHGAKMFWSHYAPEKSLQIIKESGFEVIFSRRSKAGGESHYWVLARNVK